MNQPPAITNIIVIALTVFFSYRGFINPPFLRQYLFSTRSILADDEYYRLVSSGALHADWVHLLFNMYSLYSFGSAIELFFGPGTFLVTYLAGIVGGNLLALLLHRKEDYYALGASGGVCGIIFACIFLLPGTSIQLLFIPIPIPAYVYAVLFMLFSYYGIRTQRSNIGHDAHLGGAIIGLITATALHPSIVPQNPVLYPVVMLLAVLLLILLNVGPVISRGMRQLTRKKSEDEKLFTFRRYDSDNANKK
jgi:membrane associated rhomboid family serine protease